MRALLTWTALLAATPAVAADAEVHPNDYAYGATLAIDGRSALYAAPVPLDVYRVAAEPDLGDLCVINGLGEVVPFALRRPLAARQEPAPFAVLALFPLHAPDRNPSEALKLRLRAGGTSLDLDQPPEAAPSDAVHAYLIDARGADQPLTALRLAWPADAAEFSSRLTVETSEDLARWQTVARGAAVVNLHFGGQDFVRADVPLPDVGAPFLRLSFENPAPPLVLSAVSGARRLPQPEAARARITAAARAEATAGEYEFDLGAGVPLDRINLELPEQNTVVEAEFLARAGAAKEWRSVARGRLYRLRLAGLPDLTNAPLAVPPTTARYWKVRVAGAGGGLGHGLPTLVGGWLADELLFVARGPAPFRLLYGNAAAARLAVAADALIVPADRRAAAQALQPQPAVVGARVEFGGAERLVPQRPAPDWKRWLLWAVLLAGVAALGVMARRLARET
jgi:hypothetical protein